MNIPRKLKIIKSSVGDDIYGFVDKDYVRSLIGQTVVGVRSCMNYYLVDGTPIHIYNAVDLGDALQPENPNKMTHIAYPISIRFMANKEKHIAAVIDRLQSQIILAGKVKAYIGNSYDDAVSGLMEAVKNECLCGVIQANKTAEFSDFELSYSIEEISLNRVWSGGFVVQRKDFKN